MNPEDETGWYENGLPGDEDVDPLKPPTNLAEAAQYIVDVWDTEGCDHWDIEGAIETLRPFLQKPKD